mmetsp:Transcript_10456/g.43593  ORF Transcript_10456/g.43593 Transcript_10456/m.43593 type:complete len:171 (-) Transcript_10456:158-670(-)|eukprot:CAMPEP_0113958422 /NCGR_PEP_ID=MMETSP0011_2-20120614/3414_1 /TAXON_ID=101924 /ORGANISM="Rhodosorus marinus" /LENGTH=170 /DNA_ID=CAMNT_0000969289 /DNA_START=30 /DNA_END=542 /DNA_ORIENTATION=- /assembly_acc=CAM_ASM_000156
MTKLAFIGGGLGPLLPSRHEVRARRRGMCRMADEKPLFGAIPGDPKAKTWKVKVLDSKTGEVYTADVPEDRYILYYLAEQGMEMPAQCRNGCCTTCAVKVNSGEVHQPEALGLLKEMKEKGYALMCVSYPRSDIDATTQDEDEVYVKQFGASFESGGVVTGAILDALEDD